MVFRYKGIKYAYPYVPISKKIRAYAQMMRPLTAVAAILSGFSLNYVFASVSGKGTTLVFSVLVGLVLGLLQAMGQCINQSIREEVEIDRINKKWRPTVTGFVSLKEGKILSLILFLSGVSLAFYLSFSFGIYALVIAFFAVSYTVPPFRMKKRFILNNVHQGIARGFLPAVYVASAYGYGWLAVLFGIPLAVWVSGSQGSKDITDVEGDKKFGIRTLPVVLGKDGALKVMSLFMGLSFVILSVFVGLGWLPTSFLLLNILIFPSALIIYALKKEARTDKFENSVGWLLYYGVLAGWYVLPAFLI